MEWTELVTTVAMYAMSKVQWLQLYDNNAIAYVVCPVCCMIYPASDHPDQWTSDNIHLSSVYSHIMHQHTATELMAEVL